jgi:hypothetical protein
LDSELQCDEVPNEISAQQVGMRRREYNTRLMNSKTLTVGLDLGDRQHTACVLDEAGEIIAEEAFANSREVLTAFSARYPGATFVMETGTHSSWVSRLLTAQGHPVIVANARELRRRLTGPAVDGVHSTRRGAMYSLFSHAFYWRVTHGETSQKSASGNLRLLNLACGKLTKTATPFDR